MPAKRLQITNGDEHEEHLDDTIALLSLIAAFTLEDVNEIKAQQDAKGQDGALTDEELALQLFAEEAGALDAMANDMLVAQSLDRALKADAGLLEEFARMEETARRDREYAIAISQGRRPTYQAVQPLRNDTAPRLPATSVGAPITAIGGRRLIEQSSSQRTITTLTPIASASAAEESASTSKIRTESCVICRDVIEGPVIRAPCGDTYDVGCLVDLYRAATVDESLFPPACCRQPFEFDKVRVHFDNALIKLVDSKTIEFGTKNRVYCHGDCDAAPLHNVLGVHVRTLQSSGPRHHDPMHERGGRRAARAGGADGLEAVPELWAPNRAHHRVLPHDVPVQTPILLPVHGDVETVLVPAVGR